MFHPDDDDHEVKFTESRQPVPASFVGPDGLTDWPAFRAAALDWARSANWAALTMRTTTTATGTFPEGTKGEKK